MQHPRRTATRQGNEHQSSDRTATEMVELSHVDLQAVSGGINPQPLPPRHSFE